MESGPNSRGARWNPPGLDALYCSLSREGADLELKSMLRRQPVPISKPIRIVGLKVKVERVIDLRTEGCLDLAGVTRSQMVEESWIATRAVGAAAAWLGVGGLLVPSARHDDGNLVLFVSELGPQHVTEGP